MPQRKYLGFQKPKTPLRKHIQSTKTLTVYEGTHTHTKDNP